MGDETRQAGERQVGERHGGIVRAQRRSAFAASVLDSLAPVTLGLAGLYAYYTVDWIRSPGPGQRAYVVACALTSVGYLIGWSVLRRRRPPPGWASPLSVLIALPVIAHITVRLIHTGDPGVIAYLTLAVAAFGAFVLCWPGLAILLALSGAGLAAAIVVHPAVDFHRATLQLLSGAVVGAVLQASRRRTLARLESARVELRRLAYVDELTGLPNRRAFLERAGELLERSAGAPAGSGPGLLLVDMNGLKTINDGYGHPAGDQALRQLAGLLVQHVPEADLVARLGGDEFALLVPADRLARVRARLVAALEHPPADPAAGWAVSASVGAAAAPRPGAPDGAVSVLLATADRDLYRAKAALAATARFPAWHACPDPH